MSTFTSKVEFRPKEKMKGREKRAEEKGKFSRPKRVPESFAIPIYGYITPVVIAVTLVTNTFIVIVLSQKHLRTPTNYVLLAMAITELLTGLCPLPWFIYYYTFQGYLLDRVYGLPSFWCQSHEYFAKTLPTIFHSAAVWLTIIVFLLCVCAILFELPSVFAFSRASYTWGRPHPQFNTTYHICTQQYAPWLRHSNVKDHYQLTYYWIQILLVHFIPCILLSIYSSLLIRTMRVADRRRESLFCPPTQSVLQRTSAMKEKSSVGRRMSLSSQMGASMRQFRATTKMLICVILIFLIIEIPAGIIFILHTLCASIPVLRDYMDYRYFNIALIFRNLFIMISYPINFAIYCGMSNQFRLTVRQLFSRQVLFIEQPALIGSGGRKRYSVILLDVKGFRDKSSGAVNRSGLSSRRTTGASSRLHGSIPEENEDTQLLDNNEESQSVSVTFTKPCQDDSNLPLGEQQNPLGPIVSRRLEEVVDIIEINHCARLHKTDSVRSDGNELEEVEIMV